MYSAEVYFFKFQYILTVFCFHEVQTRCYSYGIPAIYIVISEKFPYWKLVYKSSEENTTWVAQNSKTATQQPKITVQQLKITVKIDNRRRGEQSIQINIKIHKYQQRKAMSVRRFDVGPI